MSSTHLVQQIKLYTTHNKYENDLRRATIDLAKVMDLLLSPGADCASYNKNLKVCKLLLFYYPDKDLVKQFFPELLNIYNKQLDALKRFQLKVLDILWRPGGRMCNKNYHDIKKLTFSLQIV